MRLSDLGGLGPNCGGRGTSTSCKQSLCGEFYRDKGREWGRGRKRGMREREHREALWKERRGRGVEGWGEKEEEEEE